MSYEHELIDVTNVPVDTYLESLGDMRLHVALSLLLAVHANVVVTIEARIGSVWVDVSRSFFDLNTGSDGSANWSGVTTIVQLNGINATELRVRYVVSNATNSLVVVSRRL